MRRWSKIHGESLAGEICGESLGAEGLGIRQLADIARDTIIILLLGIKYGAAFCGSRSIRLLIKLLRESFANNKHYLLIGVRLLGCFASMAP